MLVLVIAARHTPKKLTKYNRASTLQDGDFIVTDMPVSMKFKQLSCGARHTVAVSTEGELFTFGSGKQGQLGHGRLVSRSSRNCTPAATMIPPAPTGEMTA